MNKDRIRQRFARAADTYDRQAVIQLKVAERLLHLLEKYLQQPPSRVLEIGSCTGLLTAQLGKLFDTMSAFYVNDLVPDFQQRVEQRLAHDPKLIFVPGDIEQIDYPENLDLVISSSTMHWLENLAKLFTNLHTSMVSGGTLCFSIYGTDNLTEVREITGVGLDYYSRSQIEALVGNVFEVIECEDEHITYFFDDPLDLLNHLRETGVNAIETMPWTRSRLEHFKRKYSEQFGHQGKVPLTYHPIYCIARKKGY